MKRFNALALVFYELLVSEQVFLHRLPALVHFLHNVQLGDKLLVLSLHYLHLLAIIFNHCVFLVKLNLEYTRRRLQFDHLLRQHCQLFLHHQQVVLSRIELLLLTALLDLHDEAVGT